MLLIMWSHVVRIAIRQKGGSHESLQVSALRTIPLRVTLLGLSRRRHSHTGNPVSLSPRALPSLRPCRRRTMHGPGRFRRNGEPRLAQWRKRAQGIEPESCQSGRTGRRRDKSALQPAPLAPNFTGSAGRGACVGLHDFRDRDPLHPSPGRRVFLHLRP